MIKICPSFFICSAFVTTLMTFVRVGPASAEDPVAVLKSLEGTWKGSGLGRQSLESGNEKVLCRVKSKFDEKKSVLTTEGQCATTKAKVKIHGKLKYHPRTDAYLGDLFSRFGDDRGSTTSSGKLVGNSIVLKTTNADDQGKIKLRGRVKITPSGDKEYSVVTTITDVSEGEAFQATDFTFVKK